MYGHGIDRVIDLVLDHERGDDEIERSGETAHEECDPGVVAIATAAHANHA